MLSLLILREGAKEIRRGELQISRPKEQETPLLYLRL